MRKGTLVVVAAVGALLFLLLLYARSRRFDEGVARADFASEHPEYEILDTAVGEGDAAAAYVHIQYCRPGDVRAKEDVWQYLRGKTGDWYLNHRETIPGDKSPCKR